MEVKNPNINKSLGLPLWSKIKSNIGANAFVDFSSLLHVGLKKKNKSFEITDNLGECEIKPIKQTIAQLPNVSRPSLSLLEFIQKSPNRKPQL